MKICESNVMFTNQGSTHGIHVMDPGLVVPRCVATDAVTLQEVYRSQEVLVESIVGRPWKKVIQLFIGMGAP